MSSGEADSYQGGNYSTHDPSEISRYARQHSEYNNDSDEEEGGVFSRAMNHVMQRGEDNREVDEEEATHASSAHDQIYNQNNGQPSEEHSTRDMGSAAAMQAFKMFSSSGGGGGNSEFIGLAMGEAQKLLNAQGGKANQAEMLQAAAGMAMKLLMTQQKGGSGGGGGSLDAVMGILGSLGGGAPPKQESSGISAMLGKFL